MKNLKSILILAMVAISFSLFFAAGCGSGGSGGGGGVINPTATATVSTDLTVNVVKEGQPATGVTVSITDTSGRRARSESAETDNNGNCTFSDVTVGTDFFVLADNVGSTIVTITNGDNQVQVTESASLTASVMDNNQYPISGATVTVAQKQGESWVVVEKKVADNDDAIVYFASLTPGDYKITAEASGYETSSYEHTLPVSYLTTVGMVLDELSTPTPDPTPTSTQTATPTPTPTVTQTASPTPTPTATQSPTPTPTATQSPTTFPLNVKLEDYASGAAVADAEITIRQSNVLVYGPQYTDASGKTTFNVVAGRYLVQATKSGYILVDYSITVSGETSLIMEIESKKVSH